MITCAPSAWWRSANPSTTPSPSSASKTHKNPRHGLPARTMTVFFLARVHCYARPGGSSSLKRALKQHTPPSAAAGAAASTSSLREEDPNDSRSKNPPSWSAKADHPRLSFRD
jgi:hypothetical protein